MTQPLLQPFDFKLRQKYWRQKVHFNCSKTKWQHRRFDEDSYV